MGEGYKVAPKEAKPYPPRINVKGSPTPNATTPRLSKVDVSKTPMPSTPRTPNLKTIHLQTGTKRETHQTEKKRHSAAHAPHQGSRRPFFESTTRYESTRHGLTFSWSYREETYFLYRSARAYISCQPTPQFFIYLFFFSYHKHSGHAKTLECARVRVRIRVRYTIKT